MIEIDRFIPSIKQKLSGFGQFNSFDERKLDSAFIKIASSIKYLNQGSEPFVLQFISCVDSESADIVAQGFAHSAASLGMGPCLVIDCKTNNMISKKYEQQKISIVQSIEFDNSIKKAVWKNRNEEEISYARLIDQNETWSKAYKLDLNQIFHEAKKYYKCVILDCPAINDVPESASISLNSDATILVVSAEITAKTAIIDTKNSILNAGGNIIGIIFNQPKRYIPSFLEEYFVHS